ncbi:conserved hypothetical protein [Methanosalsum zhilinae DSM 4017]|uniref:DUF8049 domain-containing protein n=1 Tax=Methanosalsum zhilinae (strain DSM 4017 / NBRC 107636 / OCM 62 / WeN5) TaxID=679901 RepID=F7XL85_METZD|nr:hypothetical protein [Methanosalsum zhilinae]AEH60742.1 conserved hypothetical protein [Methanosalsum zhilinae DSM 4017]
MKKLKNEIKLALLTLGCIVIIAIFSKYYLEEEMSFISRNAPLWMFLLYLFVSDKIQVSGMLRYYSAAIILISMIVIAIHMI